MAEEKLSPLAALLRKARLERTATESDPLADSEPLSNLEPLPKTGPVAVLAPPPELVTSTPTELTHPPLQTGPVSKSEPVSESEGVTFLPDNAPHMRFPYEVLDKILSEFKPGPRVVLERLYRLSAGFYSETCTVSVGKLASYCKMGTTQARQYLKILEESGRITRLSNIVGERDFGIRGILYRVNLPMMTPPQKRTPTESVTGHQSRTPTKSVANKINLKEINKKEFDASLCPDCKGTGMWYPEGYEKGAAKCRHERLRGVK